MNTVVFSGQLNINSGATINISGDNFSNVGNQGIVATGDPNATINLEYDYWGTTVPSQIQAKILDHSTDPTRPTVNFQPYVSYTSGTVASPASAVYSPSNQTLTLSATVTDSGGIIVNEGTETFTIFNGTQQVGQTTTPVNVVNGAVSATYTLPGGSRPGLYIIDVYYSGSGTDYLPSADTRHFLTVNPALPTQLVIETSPSSPTTAGQVFAPQPVIYEEDQYGDLETGDNSTVVSVSLATGSGLLGTTTATVVGGVATFTNLRDNTAGTITLEFTSGSLAPASSGDIVVNAAPADQVAFGQGPTNTTAGAAINPAVTVKVEDAYGNVVTSDSSTVTLTLSSGKFEGGSNTATATAVNGVATFSNLKIDVAGNYTLTATDGTLAPSGASNGFTISAATASQVLFGQQPSNTAAGVAINPAVAVGVEDKFGNVVTSDSSIVTLTLSSGSFDGGSSTATATAVNGVATFPSLKIDTPGNYTISATDGALTPSGASNSFTISPAAASKVVFGQQPTNSTAGVAVDPAVTVKVVDAFGNLVTGDSSTVTLTLSGGTFAGGSSTVTAAAANGVATFSNLIIDASGTYTLSATDGALTGSGASTSFTISAAAADKVVFVQQPTNAAPGAAISPPVTVDVVDTYDNVVTSNSSTVTLTLSSGTFAGGSSTATTAAVDGVATFPSLTIDTPGTYTLSATDGTLVASPASNSFVISGPGAAKVVFGQQPTNATAGVAISPAVTVKVVDALGNLITNNSSLVTVTLSGGTFAGGLATEIAAAVNGIATFASLKIDAAGTYTLSATDGTLTGSGPSNTFSISAAAADKVAFSQQPSNGIAGSAVSPAVTVNVEDSFGNVVTGNSSTVTLTLSSNTFEGGSKTVTAVASSGIATFSDLKIDATGTYTLSATDTGLASSQPSSVFIISPATATRLVVTTSFADPDVAGSKGTVTVTAYDMYDNVVSGGPNQYLGTVSLSSTDPLISGLPASYASVASDDGSHTFTNAAFKTVGSQTITATDSTNRTVTGTSGTVTVEPAAASQLVVTQQPSPTATVGVAFTTQPVVSEADPYGNVITSDSSSTVTAARGNVGTGDLQGSNLTVTLVNGVAAFSGLSYDSAETMNISFSTNASGVSSTISQDIVVEKGAASRLVVSQAPSSTATAGQKFAIQPVVDVEDQNGNIETSDNSTVVSVSLAGELGLPDGTTSLTVKNGVATFTDLSVTTAGTIALEFTGDGLTSGTSKNIVVSPAAPFRLAIHTQPSSTATAGQPFETQPVIYELDQYGNLETGDNKTTITASLSSGVGPLIGAATATVVGGAATFTNLSDNLVGTISLDFSGGALSVGPSNNIAVSPGAAAQLKVATQPFASVTAGNMLTDPIVIDVEDANGNIVTGDNSTVVTASLGSGAGTLIGTTTATVVNGVASFNDLEVNTAGTLTLKFASGKLAPVISNPSVISPALASSI